MRIFSVFLLVILVSSCINKSIKSKNDCTNNSGISDSLYNAILFYQTQNPIPIYDEKKDGVPPSSESLLKYIYEVQFIKERDTVAIITLKLNGVRYQKNMTDSIYGVFEDSCLKATYLIDNEALSKNFYNTIQREKIGRFQI
ncbi:MAG: hypothetical protein IPO01_17155 [Chitinophagaceae bacterium]|nr:hypothetical protein [Chitinophagaceae bacterium]